MGEMVEFETEVGRAAGYLVLPEQGNGPGVLLLHAWWGLNEFFKSLADRLAADGFVVLAPDLNGGRTAATIEEAEVLRDTVDSEQAVRQAIGGLDYLRAHPSVTADTAGVIGFSMGAAFASWLAVLKPEVGAVVLFYGGADDPEHANRTDAAFLGHFAEVDPYESSEDMRHFEAALVKRGGREGAFHVYPGTGHWFFENDRPDAYDAAAADLAWARTTEFLHRYLG